MRTFIVAAGAAAIAGAIGASLSAQWPPHQVPGIPRLPDGTPNLAAPAPRTPDGKPDLSGIWENFRRQGETVRSVNAGFIDPPSSLINEFRDVGTGVEGGLPFRPWAEELKRQRMEQHGKDNPDAHCLPLGPMQLHTHIDPRRIVQTPTLVVIIYEANYGLRQIFLDGRPAPTGDPQPWWYGYSRGWWEGDTLVAETTHLRDGGWLDIHGSPFTDAVKFTERFRRPNFGTLEIDITVDDPKAYTRPWTVSLAQRLMVDMEMLEFICLENEKSSQHYVGK
jgi:hypothetical protein